MNPFTLDANGTPFPLDMRGELDDTAAFKSGKKWGDLEFPLPFGRSMTSAEEHVHELDANTGKAHPFCDILYIHSSCTHLLKVVAVIGDYITLTPWLYPLYMYVHRADYVGCAFC